MWVGSLSPSRDPNAELDPLLRRGACVTLGHPALHLYRAAHGIHHARKLRKQVIAGILYGTPPMLLDFRIDQLPETRFEPCVRPLLIRPIRRECPARSAARIAVRRRTGGMTCPAVDWLDWLNQV